MTYEYTLQDHIDDDSIIIPLNASSLKCTGCEQQYMYTVFEGLVEKRIDDKLLMGTALHKFAEVYCMAYPLKDKKAQRDLFAEALLAGRATLADMPWIIPDYISAATACPILSVPIEDIYWERMREYKLVIPWRLYRHSGRKYHTVLCATFDQVTFMDETVTIVDYKSTRYRKISDADHKYAKESQFIHYMWMFKTFFRRFMDPKYNEAILKNRIITLPYFIQLGSAAQWIHGIPQGYQQHMVTKYEEQLEITLNDFILPLWFSGKSSRTGWLANVCSNCNFTNICFDDDARDSIIKSAFKQQMYAGRYFPQRYNKNQNQNDTIKTTNS